MSLRVQLHHGDSLAVLPTLEADSFDSVVTDPPYHLTAGKKGGSGDASVNPNSPAGRAMISTGFMGKQWDGGDIAFRPAFWREVLRVMKPGAHLVAFGGTRTYHRMVCGIEDAGFEIRDQIGWVYGSGFPKSSNQDGEWEGWGTALKPAWEPIVLARNPLIGTVPANLAVHGCGALNIDGCRVAVSDEAYAKNCSGDRGHDENRKREMGFAITAGSASTLGRWPANLTHDGSDEVLACFPKAPGALAAVTGTEPSSAAVGTRCFNAMARTANSVPRVEVEKSAARFFYCAKASKQDREAGLDGFASTNVNDGRKTSIDNAYQRGDSLRKNTHPTVKPTDLMRWLCRLVTPPGGRILDPFLGSGSTGRAAVIEGFAFTGIELEAEYAAISKARISEQAGILTAIETFP